MDAAAWLGGRDRPAPFNPSAAFLDYWSTIAMPSSHVSTTFPERAHLEFRVVHLDWLGRWLAGRTVDEG